MYSNSKINEIVFRYDSDVFHIVYGAWVGYLYVGYHMVGI